MSNPWTMQKILIIGGSGFLSGTLARLAVTRGHKVWTITRGQRELPGGVNALIADRHNLEAFKEAVAGAGTDWDLVVDCIAFQPTDIQQDILVVRERARHLVFISTDFVYDPLRRQFPQREDAAHYVSEGYGANKRLCELDLMHSDTGGLAWTVLRPTHIYGPGSGLGCLPAHSRDAQLIARLQAGERLQLVGGGHFLQQPILARDLADLILSLGGNEKTYGEIYNAAGPDIIESRTYYAIIADVLGVGLEIEELPVSAYAAQHPEAAPFLCHRIYDLGKLQASRAAVPSTSIAQGLREHVESLLGVHGTPTRP